MEQNVVQRVLTASFLVKGRYVNPQLLKTYMINAQMNALEFSNNRFPVHAYTVKLEKAKVRSLLLHAIT